MSAAKRSSPRPEGDELVGLGIHASSRCGYGLTGKHERLGVHERDDHAVVARRQAPRRRRRCRVRRAAEPDRAVNLRRPRIGRSPARSDPVRARRDAARPLSAERERPSAASVRIRRERAAHGDHAQHRGRHLRHVVDVRQVDRFLHDAPEIDGQSAPRRCGTMSTSAIPPSPRSRAGARSDGTRSSTTRGPLIVFGLQAATAPVGAARPPGRPSSARRRQLRGGVELRACAAAARASTCESVSAAFSASVARACPPRSQVDRFCEECKRLLRNFAP